MAATARDRESRPAFVPAAPPVRAASPTRRAVSAGPAFPELRLPHKANRGAGEPPVPVDFASRTASIAPTANHGRFAVEVLLMSYRIEKPSARRPGA